MKFFSKNNDELDFRCWNCKKLMNHKKIKWKPRKWVLPKIDGREKEYEELLKQSKEVSKILGKNHDVASPNNVFGFQEYEYHGICPNCNTTVNCFWFGRDSLKNKTFPVELDQRIECTNCNYTLAKEFQVLYSYRILVKEPGQYQEILVLICSNCKAEIAYPFQYDLERGTIQ